MKYIIVITLAVAAGFGLAALLLPVGSDTTVATTDTGSTQLYTCGMHPEIISEEPGYCPICSMKLTPKKEGGAAAEGAITVDPATRQNMGLVTTPAGYASLSRSVHAFGRVDYSEPHFHSVNLKIDGWVENLFVAYEGEQVFRGQPLLSIYSPELVAAQREFLIAHEANAAFASAGPTGSTGGMDGLLNAARTRLANWDISDDQIEQLVNSGEITRTMTIRAPAGGYVVAKQVDEGDRLTPGTELYRIADLSEVWVRAHVYEQDLPFVSVGQTARVEIANLPGETFEGTVNYVSPFLDRGGQAEVRLTVDNPDGRLKPDMYAEVSIKADLHAEQLVIPRSAVINSGTRQLVFVASDEGAYQPREIITGAVGNNDMVAVRSGLAAGEPVVTSGQFLLDSESRLTEALGDDGQGGHGGHQHGDMSGGEEVATTLAEERGLSGVYTCPMPEHFNVVQYGEGECPECGMALVPVEETENDDVYICPMRECGVASDTEGRCPVCGMHLQKLERPEQDTA
ncbi:efflux RND transporter periplasmic adaptor subunit, partial [candidate division GN15 bacterium]|nr:efflux RND transporter periplasmic adaptor subunit [candidate division GN15 bacterium]